MSKPARIWIPAEKNVPRPFLCESCGARFRLEQRAEFVRHCATCSAQHEEEERAASPRAMFPENNVFSPHDAYVIPDLEEWTAKNRDALIRGAKKY